MVGYALFYARMGLRVFPVFEVRDGYCACGRLNCKSPGKHPAVNDFLNVATTDREQIMAWWDIRPGANIGIATGKASGIWVLDVDGEVDLPGPIPSTLSWRTGGGGYHYVFSWVDGIRNRVSMFAGLDVRGEGGFVVAPPSKHISGAVYEIIDYSPIAFPPDWLVEAVRGGSSENFLYAVGKPFKISEGCRNNTLFRIGLAVGGELRHYIDMVNHETLRDLLVDINERYCQPPLDKEEISMIARSVVKYVNPPGK